MSKNLVIVESPAKAKTIEGYLGKDFTVKSFPRYPSMVLALAGDSTITKFFDIYSVFVFYGSNISLDS